MRNRGKLYRTIINWISLEHTDTTTKTFQTSYYNLDLMSACLSAFSSVVCGPIGTKLGRKIGGGSGKDLKLLVSMTTNLLPWQPKKGYFTARLRFLLDITLLLWRHG